LLLLAVEGGVVSSVLLRHRRVLVSESGALDNEKILTMTTDALTTSSDISQRRHRGSHCNRQKTDDGERESFEFEARMSMMTTMVSSS